MRQRGTLETAAASAYNPTTMSTVEVPRGTESVLLVEPDAETRVLASFMLRRLGYCVTEARGGVEAFKLHGASDSAFDLLLASAVMPRVNGHDLADLLRARWPELRVLLLADAEYERAARRNAARRDIGFLCRPFTMAVLAARVRECLDKGKPMFASHRA